MKRMVFKIGVIIVPLILSFSMVLVLNKHGGVAQYAQNLFETENDYRLKFVDSTDVELSLGETNKVIFPVDVISAREEAGKIYVETFENAVILAPADCIVQAVNPNDSEIELVSGSIRVVLTGVISGVQAGNVISCGEVIGTVKGTECIMQVFWKSQALSLSEIRALL